MNRTLCLLALLAVVPGCQGVHFHDSVDTRFDFEPFDPFHPPDDDLHQPYVVGTEFWMYAYRDYDTMHLQDAYAVSLEPRVLDVDELWTGDEHIGFRCFANAVGTTEIEVHDEGVAGSATVEVAAPDKVRLVFAGPYFIDAELDEYLVTGPVNVLKGGTATFQVLYFEGNRRLWGAGVLEAVASGPDLVADPVSTYFGEDREWIQVTPATAGNHSVELRVGDRVVGRLDITAVEPEDVDFIELRAESESGADRDDWLAVLAIGYTAGGDPIYGIEYEWKIDGIPQPGEGDLFKYEYEPSDRTKLEADYAGHEQSVYIHADWGYVSSTNHLGCTAGGRPDGAVAALLALGVLFTLSLRRRAH